MGHKDKEKEKEKERDHDESSSESEEESPVKAKKKTVRAKSDGMVNALAKEKKLSSSASSSEVMFDEKEEKEEKEKRRKRRKERKERRERRKQKGEEDDEEEEEPPTPRSRTHSKIKKEEKEKSKAREKEKAKEEKAREAKEEKAKEAKEAKEEKEEKESKSKSAKEKGKDKSKKSKDKGKEKDKEAADEGPEVKLRGSDGKGKRSKRRGTGVLSPRQEEAGGLTVESAVPAHLKRRGGRPASMVYKDVLLVAEKDWEGAEGELSFKKGEFLCFMEKDDNGWVRATLDGKDTWFPKEYVSLAPGQKQNPLEDKKEEVVASLIEKKQETAKHLDSWLKNRPSQEEVHSRNILDTKEEESEETKIVQKKKKRALVSRLFSQRPLRRLQSESKSDLTALVAAATAKPTVFGMTLGELLVDDLKVPRIVEEAIAYLDSVNAHELEGIFRKSGGHATLQAIKELYETPESSASLSEKCDDPHCVAVMMKQFFGAMREPVVPYDQYDQFIAGCKGAKDEEELGSTLKKLVSGLPQQSYDLMHFLVKYLHKISSNSEVNMMTGNNLGVVFGPNLFRTTSTDPFVLMDTTSTKIMEHLIEHCPEIFA